MELSPSEKRYVVHSMFVTIQGEGVYSGRRAVFVRFSGCNVWSGREQDRERDATKGLCARICDTEFSGVDWNNGGGRYTAKELVDRVRKLWGDDPVLFSFANGWKDNDFYRSYVVLTGGEPGLQVDQLLVHAFHEAHCYVAIETNGSQQLPPIDWVVLSPKPPMVVLNQRYDEIKVLYPLYNPLDFLQYGHSNTLYWVQPVDSFHPWARTDDARDASDEETRQEHRQNPKKCIEFVHKNPGWGISVQLHKILGIQ